MELHTAAIVSFYMWFQLTNIYETHKKMPLYYQKNFDRNYIHLHSCQSLLNKLLYEISKVNNRIYMLWFYFENH